MHIKAQVSKRENDLAPIVCNYLRNASADYETEGGAWSFSCRCILYDAYWAVFSTEVCSMHINAYKCGKNDVDETCRLHSQFLFELRASRPKCKCPNVKTTLMRLFAIISGTRRPILKLKGVPALHTLETMQRSWGAFFTQTTLILRSMQ